MRYSQLLIPTVKEVPAEAEIPSHQLMIRAGLIRKVASGTYTYLPLGWRSLRKISQIVREEMDAAGAQEISMPILQPMELWQQTGRDADYGPTMCRFQDRHGRWNTLAPTAEEVVTTLVAGEVSSYKQLPINLYQIGPKFRDEFRPRFGVLRSREFLMKDAYSFDADAAGLEESYRRMYDAYCRVFDRCGLRYVIVEAESGPIGGSASHEFMVTCSAGEDTIVHTDDYSYAANIEKAEVDAPRSTGVSPVDDAKPQAVPAMEQVHTPDKRTIDEVCEFLQTKPDEMIKTLIYWRSKPDLLAEYPRVEKRFVKHLKDFSEFAIDKDSPSVRGATLREFTKHLEKNYPKTGLPKSKAFWASFREYSFTRECLEATGVVVLLRGNHELNENKLARFCGHETEIAPEELVRFFTGAKVGFAGPVGLAERVGKLIIDHSVAAMGVGVAGANRTDYHVRNVVPGRDFPLEGENVVVADIRNAVEGDTRNGEPLQFSRGVEVGHVFKLGTKYSEKLDATFLDENGGEKPCVMGCYGIGINRILAAAIETAHDEHGCVLPVSIAPFEVLVIPLNNDKPNVRTEAERIYNELTSVGADALLDDRNVRPGVKFKDADLLGIPLRIVVGERGLKDGNVEIKRRTDAKPAIVPAADAVAETMKILTEMKESLAPKQ